jgi:hypothetical protein
MEYLKYRIWNHGCSSWFVSHYWIPCSSVSPQLLSFIDLTGIMVAVLLQFVLAVHILAVLAATVDLTGTIWAATVDLTGTITIHTCASWCHPRLAHQIQNNLVPICILSLVSQNCNPMLCIYCWHLFFIIKSLVLIWFSSVILRFTVDSNPRWCCTYLLDASDPLFIEIGKLFIEEQIRGRICCFGQAVL